MPTVFFQNMKQAYIHIQPVSANQLPLPFSNMILNVIESNFIYKLYIFRLSGWFYLPKN